MKSLLLFILLILAAACQKDDSLKEQLDWAEQEMNSRTDSVVRLLDAMPRSELRGSKRARHALLYAQALDKSYINITNDSLTRIAVNYYDRHGTPHEKALAHYYQGAIHDYAGELEEAVESFTYAELYSRKDDDNYLKGLIYSRFGNLYIRQRNFKSAVEMYTKASECFSPEQKKNRMLILHSLGIAQLELRRNRQAATTLSEAEQLALELDNPHALVDIFSALGLAQIGAVYHSKSDYYASVKEKLTKYYAEHTNGEIPEYHYPIIAQILLDEGNIDSARYYYLLHLSKPESRNEDDIIYYRHLSSLEWEAGNYEKALTYEQTFSHLSDSLHHAKQSQLVENLNQRYLTKHAHESYLLLRTKHRHMITTGTLLIIVIIGLSWHLIQNQRRKAHARRRELAEFQAYAEQSRQHYGELESRYQALSEELNLRDEHTQELYAMLGNRIDAIRTLVEMAHLYSHDKELFYKNFKEVVKFSSSKSHDLAKDLIAMADLLCGGAMQHLQSHYPTLTQHELCYCACVLLGFSKESIRILYNHTNQYSIYNIQNSIRTKTGLVNHSSTNLESFLEELKRRG